MKKSLIISYILIFLSIVVAPICLGADPIYFYRDVFKKEDIRVDILGTSDNVDITALKKEFPLLLIKSDQFKEYVAKDVSGLWDLVIVVCNSSLSLESPDFTCDSKEMLNSKEILNTPVAIREIKGVNYFFIPEKYFIYPTNQKLLIDYMTLFSDFKDAPDPVNTPEEDAIRVSNFFRYIFFIFIIFTLLYKSLPALKQDKGFLLKKDFYITNIFKFFKWLNWFKNYNIYILLIIILSYPILLTTISLKDLGVFDIEYVLVYLTDTLNPTNFAYFLEYKNLTKISLSLCNYFLLIFIVLTLLPEVFFGTISLLKTLSTKKFNRSFSMFAYVFFIVCFLLLCLFFDLGKYIYPLVIVLLGFIYFSLYIDFSTDASFKKLRFIIVSLFIIVLVVMVYGNKGGKSIPKLRNLVEQNTHIFFTPYTRDFSKSDIFSSFFINATVPLYIDEYLVYTPDFSKINIKDISEFSSDASLDNIVFTAGSTSKYARYLMKDPNLVNLVKSETFTKKFLINSVDMFNKDTYIKMVFDCTDGMDPSRISAYVYSEYSYSDRSINLLDFPGCINGEISYEIPIKYTSVDSDIMFFSLSGFAEDTLLSLEVMNATDEKSIPVTFVNDPDVNKIVYSNIINDKASEINLFVFDKITTTSFEIKDHTNFDISIPLNLFIKNGLLDKSFTIWSPEGNVIIGKESI